MQTTASLPVLFGQKLNIKGSFESYPKASTIKQIVDALQAQHIKDIVVISSQKEALQNEGVGVDIWEKAPPPSDPSHRMPGSTTTIDVILTEGDAVSARKHRNAFASISPKLALQFINQAGLGPDSIALKEGTHLNETYDRFETNLW